VSTSNTRTWQDNAAEFALLDKGEGWPFARLIACSVERRGQGGSNGNQHTGGIVRSHNAKVSAHEFAGRAGTSHGRVLRYLAAWDKAADQGLCTPSADLTPADAPTVMEPDIAWGSIYDARKAGGRPRDTRAGDAAEIIASRGAAEVVAAMTDRERDGMATELRRRQRADAEAVAEQMMQDELASGVDDREGAALRDSNRARLKLHQPLIEASYTLVQVDVAWREWHGLLSPADRATLPGILNEMQARLAALQLTITDDVVGEVLKHDEGR
jgi:hypothetical protein